MLRGVTARDERPAGYHDWYYVVEPQGAPRTGTILAGDGRRLSRRVHGYAARVCVDDSSGAALPLATLLRAAAAAGTALEAKGYGPERALRLDLGPAGTQPTCLVRPGGERAGLVGSLPTWRLDGPAVMAAPTRHDVEAQARALLDAHPLPAPSQPGAPLEPAAARVLFFESLMASNLPHNEVEISQGVLHMLSALGDGRVEPVRVDLKMPIGDRSGPLRGVERLRAALREGPIHLVCVTLLEDYFDGVVRLVALLRELGCPAHVAVGGVMPTLSPEHVAAHLPDVSFVCRGAGEYFVPRLAAIVGSSAGSEPWSDDQCAALMAMDGLLAIDRASGRLLACNPGRVVEVDDLGAIELDLSHLEPRHIEGGIEISTARGCLHHCGFCSIMGRGTYRARAADDVLRMLKRYQERFAELFGDDVPPNAFRVHISDDDFGCDRRRAREILHGLGQTPFRLSSIQLSIGDLCQRSGRRLLAEPDPVLLDALRPSCFADSYQRLSMTEVARDYRQRSWSSYLQVGVESFCDRELVRLGKGYRVRHVRRIIAALSQREIHLDAYFILSNSDTSADDLIASLEEIARLKLRHPRFFHLRHPAVSRLVSYFPSASHKRKMRAGATSTLELRRVARVPNHPEFDYPFVDHDVPRDEWVRFVADRSVLTDGRRYTDSLVTLRQLWRERVLSLPEGSERRRGELLVRRLDDAPRRLVFEWLSEANRLSRAATGEEARRQERAALGTAEELLGSPERWLVAFRRHEHEVAPRLVVIPTWECELRCRYCYVAKQEGRTMTRTMLERAIDLLLSSCRPAVTLQFFGGEPLCRFDLVQHGIEHASGEAKRQGRDVQYIVSSNGVSLDEARLEWLAAHPVRLELSLDGDRATHNANRPARDRTVDSYLAGIATKVDAIHEAGIPYDVIMVVHPGDVGRLVDNYLHIADLGFRRIQLNFGLGARWSEDQQRQFAAELHRLGQELRRRWRTGDPVTLVNLENKPLPMRLNGEITVDYDGTIYGGNGFLHETRHKARFRIGHLDDLGGFDRYWLDAPTNEYLLEWTYPPDVTANNLQVGRIMSSFVGWLQGELTSR
jgi:radical SAM superfamily enzyme YgiQ (UPF0313 family)